VSQTLYALAERPRTPEIVEWLDRLERFDEIVRPPSRRGQATKGLLRVARARFDGNAAVELEEAEATRPDLYFLPRHVKRLDDNGWWPRPPET
jgi:hypothetical protein